MSSIKQAIIPVAGRGTRLYPASSVMPKGLIPLVDTDGIAKAAVHMVIEQCVASGIEEVTLVVAPGTEEAYRHYFTPIAPGDRGAYNAVALAQSERIEFLSRIIRYAVQERPLGFGDAVYSARQVVSGGPFVVLLGDHVHLSRNAKTCLGQTLAVAEESGRAVFAVHDVDEAAVSRCGIVAGQHLAPNVLRVEEIVEKPTVEYARANLRTRNGRYRAHFGIYVFTPTVLQVLDEMAAEQADGEVQLTEAQIRLLRREVCLAFLPDGESYDFGVPEGLIETQRALADFARGR